MLSKLPSFFPKELEKEPSEIQFLNLTKTAPEINELYRGFDNLQSVLFGLPTLLMGVFGKTYPEVVTMDEVMLHKLTNLSNDYHMVSMSENPQIAYDWGNGDYMTIDPTLFRPFCVNVHASYRRHNLNLPGKMEKELEHIALCVPYCCIKNIIMRGKIITNPFYLAISPSNHEAIQEFTAIYLQLVTLLRNKYTNKLSEPEEKISLRDFVTQYLRYYDRYGAENNPFKRTLQELTDQYAEYMEYFLRLTPQLSMTKSMREISLTDAENILANHFYTHSIDVSTHKAKTATTYLEDEWARPMFD
ncbi:hypothetical protein [Legionella waltersii]|uniref:Uncharacterized protein n=1 Tax=Legionella waltersii TaxID=66969 RepID=A0A0W1ACI5_9GAMM|nr:hypothetical protein [Legionella waltersii]KTD78819.1 hypothetical protein Lwal_1589 [Legionella waltersii]SNV10978.1 Uncharacterised protein [Legionella waltersii]